MTDFRKLLDKNCKSKNIQLRPLSGHGIWLSALLFLAYLLTILRAPETIQISYEVSTILLLGMFLQSLEVFFMLTRDKTGISLALGLRTLPAFVTSILIWAILHQTVIFSCFTGLIVLFFYRISFLCLLKSLPFSFSLGEAAVVSQSLTIFLYNCFLSLPFMNHSKSLQQDLNLILQIGLLAVIVLILVPKFIKIFRKWFMFYFLLVSVIVAICVIPLRQRPAVLVLIEFIFSDLERIAVVGIYLALLVLAGATVTWQIRKNQSVTTSTRKIFHILIVLVFVPGLIYQCQFLYVASVVILAVFIVLELARGIKLYPVSEVLNASVEAFIDDKDAGGVALTPLYLLAGCSAPLWIHNSPCDLTGSSEAELLPLLSGVLSIGIGDTFASFIGSKIGRHKWPKSQKSVEGTIASIIAQCGFIYLLANFGFLNLSTRLAAITGVAVIANSLVEALTDQVDNLVLPLVTYIVLVIK